MNGSVLPQCPSGDFSCPYWTRSGCKLEDPAHECDDYMFYHSGDDDED